MSLVTPADSYSTSCGESKIYTLEGKTNSSNLSTQIFNSDKQKFNYGIECHESYGQRYLSDSPTDVAASQVDFLHLSNSSFPGTAFHSQAAAPYQIATSFNSSNIAQNSPSSPFMATEQPNAYCSYPVSECLDVNSPERTDYDEDEIRLKLQELEIALLNDNEVYDDDDDGFGSEQRMEIDSEWAEYIKCLLLPNSPKESSSPDTNNSGISSNKEESMLPSTPKQLLFECAAVISEGNLDGASALITELRQMVSIQGDPPQRIAAYMVEGLVARMAASGKGLYKALKCKEPPTSDRLSAMQILFEVCPCFKFGFMAANGAIIEAFKDEKRAHIIDFDINQGSQYITLIQALAAQPGEPPHVKITGVDDPESVQRSVGGLRTIGQRLENLAEAVGLPFEFRAIAAKTADVTPSMLDCQPGEALVVNFAFQLHHMPDESVSTVNQRDELLRMVKSLCPKLVTVVEQDVNTNTAPFLPRFVEAYNYYYAVFESLDATLPRESPDRINVERHCLARDIVNIVACEGEERIERYEVAGKWKARMTMAGFKPYALSQYVKDSIQKLLKQYCNRYKVKDEQSALHFGWEDKILVVASAWL